MTNLGLGQTSRSFKGLLASALLITGLTGFAPSMQAEESVSELASSTASAPTIVVDKNGGGHFTTVQAAVDSIPDGNSSERIIQVKPGTYAEKIFIPTSKTNITLIGENANNTILTYNDTATTAGSTTNSASTSVRANNFQAKNITFKNTAGRNAGQAVALYVSGDRSRFENIRVLGFQDTLYSNGGRQYYKNSYIEGTVDFIFGRATAVFDNCEIRSLGNGYITAASTEPTSEYGYVFMNSRITRSGTGDHSVYLGRPWRPYSAVIFMNNWMDKHIRPEGWHNWGNAANEATARYAEFNNSGPGWNDRNRVGWSNILTSAQASAITIQSVLGGSDGWDPR